MTNEPPFRAELVASTHSALAGVLAGFALFALFLLIERDEGKKDPAKHSKAMLLLFVAFLTGSLASYLYSTITGDSGVRAYYLFLFPSTIFAIHVFTLLAGVVFCLSACKIEEQICTIARRISYAVIGFSVLIVGSDQYKTSEFFGLPVHTMHRTLILIAITSLSAVAFVRFKSSCLSPFAKATFSAFCYAALLMSVFVAYTGGEHFYVKNLELPFWIPVFHFAFVSIFAAWTILVMASVRQTASSSSDSSTSP